jgi:PEP-CTERM motif
MYLRRIMQTVSIFGVAAAMMAASASATPITFNTSATGTGGSGFNAANALSLTSSSGAAATLSFETDGNSSPAVPSGINFGIFDLTCMTCTAQGAASPVGATFGAFTFDLMITDVSDGATGVFVGTSTGGSVFLDQSTIKIVWAPAQLGSGANNASSGNFEATSFTITPFSIIVFPTSGANPGQTTVQGGVDAVPEPATLGMVGAAFLGLGLLRRKKVARP